MLMVILRRAFCTLLIFSIAMAGLPLTSNVALAGIGTTFVKKHGGKEALDKMSKMAEKLADRLESVDPEGAASLRKAAKDGTLKQFLEQGVSSAEDLATAYAAEANGAIAKNLVSYVERTSKYAGNSGKAAGNSGTLIALLAGTGDIACGLGLVAARKNLIGALVNNIHEPVAVQKAQAFLDILNDLAQACREAEFAGFEKAPDKAKPKKEEHVLTAEEYLIELQRKAVAEFGPKETKCFKRLFGSDAIPGYPSPEGGWGGLIGEYEGLVRGAADRAEKLGADYKDLVRKINEEKKRSDAKSADYIEKYEKQIQDIVKKLARDKNALDQYYKKIFKLVNICGPKLFVFLPPRALIHQQLADFGYILGGNKEHLEQFRKYVEENRKRWLKEQQTQGEKVASVARKPISFQAAVRETQVCVATKYTFTSGEGVEVLTTSLLSGPYSEIGEFELEEGGIFEEQIEEESGSINEPLVMVTPDPSAPGSGPQSIVEPTPTAPPSQPAEATPSGGWPEPKAPGAGVPTSQTSPPTNEPTPVAPNAENLPSGLPGTSTALNNPTPQNEQPPKDDEPTLPKTPKSVERDEGGQPQPEPTPDDYGLVKATTQVMEIALMGGNAGEGQPIDGAQIKLLAPVPSLPDEQGETVELAELEALEGLTSPANYVTDVASGITGDTGNATIELVQFGDAKPKAGGLGGLLGNLFGKDGIVKQGKPSTDPDDEDPAELGDSEMLAGKPGEYKREVAAKPDNDDIFAEDPNDVGEDKVLPKTGEHQTAEPKLPSEKPPYDSLTSEIAKKLAEAAKKANPKTGGGSGEAKAESDEKRKATAKAKVAETKNEKKRPALELTLPAGSFKQPYILGFNSLEALEKFYTPDAETGSFPDKIQSLGSPSRSFKIGENVFTVFENYQEELSEYAKFFATNQHVAFIEEDPCRNKEEVNDLHFNGSGLWGQDFDNQWAIKQVGFKDTNGDAWTLAGEELKPVVVAVIDTGIDWYHPDLPFEKLWKNEAEIAGNGLDDDGNGFVDDTIGWNFVDNDRKPWDYDGHGTFVAGVIAAAKNNGLGIAGINPSARIMPVKALDAFGNGHASMIAQAITYAVDNGADIINLSLGGQKPTRIEQLAIDHAITNDVLVITASGNKGASVADYSPAGLSGVLTVAATDRNDKRAKFSNWGPAIDIAAPGVDVLSLRARNTDLLAHIPDVDYEAGKGILGEDRAYFRASGTSFAAPIVAGTASLLLSRNPQLNSEQIRRMVLNSAYDIDSNGIDNYTGYGRLDAVAALKADPDYFVEARISKIKVVQVKGQQAIQIFGTVASNNLKFGQLSIGKGANPEKWLKVKTKITEQKINASLLALPAKVFATSKQWTLKLIVEDLDGNKREANFALTIG